MMAQTKGDNLVLQVGGWATSRLPVLIKRLKGCQDSTKGRKTRWKDDVEADLRAMKITNWKKSIEDKLAWKKIVEQA
jgi:hypothetical protein